MRSRLSLMCAVLLPVAASACLNDRDTLAAQSERFPDAVRIITGRYERNPKEFYTVRIRRVEGELKANPRRLDLYDDVAVAYDRIGDSAAALGWMSRKRQLLEPLNLPKPGSRLDERGEAVYRYFANVGTFRVHRWLREGAKPSRIGELRQARQEIATALKLKPNAHFGREPVQLGVMDWILDSSAGGNASLGDFLIAEAEHLPEKRIERSKAIAQGLLGLIAMGDAWRSVDVAEALAGGISWHYRSRDLGEFAALRHDELVNQGGKSLFPKHARSIYFPSQILDDVVRSNFTRLRSEADQWHRQREAFMVARLADGRHPDTDPKFWEGYESPRPPAIVEPFRWGTVLNYAFFYGLPALFVALPVLILLALVQRRRRSLRLG